MLCPGGKLCDTTTTTTTACPLASLQDNHVVVMTPQLFLNMLNAGAAHFHQISLLVRLPWRRYACGRCVCASGHKGQRGSPEA